MPPGSVSSRPSGTDHARPTPIGRTVSSSRTGHVPPPPASKVCVDTSPPPPVNATSSSGPWTRPRSSARRPAKNSRADPIRGASAWARSAASRPHADTSTSVGTGPSTGPATGLAMGRARIAGQRRQSGGDLPERLAVAVDQRALVREGEGRQAQRGTPQLLRDREVTGLVLRQPDRRPVAAQGYRTALEERQQGQGAGAGRGHAEPFRGQRSGPHPA